MTQIWGRKGVYCGAENVPLEGEHIVPKARGGSTRISNRTLACHTCNQKKGDVPVEIFLKKKPDVLKKIREQCKTQPKDTACVNATRSSLLDRLKKFCLPVTTGTGGQTKWNRMRLHIPKEHWLDAACVGTVSSVSGINRPALRIQCMDADHSREQGENNG